MSVLVVSSERFAEHQTPPGHPESQERAAVMDAVAGDWHRGGGQVVAPQGATREQLGRVHDEDFLRRIDALAGQSAAVDPDTFTSPSTVAIARLAAGAAIQGVEYAMGAAGQRALALVRPPGHHAERGRAQGFCIYNNVAVAAEHAKRLGARRVAVVDYDVHHGNGTEHIFFDDPTVLYVSVHQFPFYPGTGAATDIGTGAGRGFTVNVPLEVGATDNDYRVVFDNVVVPVVRQFTPDVVIVSAGFDAHHRDPLGGMRLTTEAFAAMTADLSAVADECCEGRLLAVTEGGYDVRAFGDSLAGVVRALAAAPGVAANWPASPLGSSRGINAARKVRSALSGFWRLTG